MTAQIFYTKGSPSEGEATEFAGRLSKLRVNYRLVDADSGEGAALSELYDLTGRPAVVLTADDGGMIERWQNDWPLPADISYLVHQ